MLFETAYLDYHIHRRLSRTFLIFFNQLSSCSSTAFRQTFVCLKRQLIKNITISCVCQLLFYSFLNLVYIAFKNNYVIFASTRCLPTLSLATTQLIYHSSRTLSISFSKLFYSNYLYINKRRKRDLNPRAAINDLLPFQGSPFGQLGYFSKLS